MCFGSSVHVAPLLRRGVAQPCAPETLTSPMAAAGLVLTRFETEEEVAVDATMPQRAIRNLCEESVESEVQGGEEEALQGEDEAGSPRSLLYRLYANYT